jgi:hypothetical protein
MRSASYFLLLSYKKSLSCFTFPGGCSKIAMIVLEDPGNYLRWLTGIHEKVGENFEQVHAKNIADLLIEVMDRRTKEEKEGKKQSSSQKRSRHSPEQIKKGLEELGRAKSLHAELQWLAEGKRPRPGLKQLRPEDLPPGVTASRGYDHRGHCLIYSHKTLGELGKIVLIKIDDGHMLIQADLYKGQGNLNSPLVKKKRDVFEKVVATVNNCFDENFPD